MEPQQPSLWRITLTAGQAAGGNRPGPFRVVARNLAKVISATPCFLGFALIIFPGKRALHDLLTGSRVVHRRRN